MRILITGATGFVGAYLARELASADPSVDLWGTEHVVGVPVPPLPLAEGEKPVPIRLLNGNLTHPDFVRKVVAEARPDQVYHLAGFASAAGTDRDLIFAVNVTATVDLLQALHDAGRACHILLASSGYVYGATKPGHPAKEDDPISPVGAYAESKAAMEAAAGVFAEAAADGPLRLTTTRAFNHTGPRQHTEFVVPAFARQIARIESGLEAPVVRVGNLDARRDFLDVRDVVRAYRLLSVYASSEPFRIVNVSSRQAVTIRTLLDRLVAQARVPLTVEADPARMRPSDMAECAGDPSLLTQITGWHPEIALDQTLADTLAWWRSQ